MTYTWKPDENLVDYSMYSNDPINSLYLNHDLKFQISFSGQTNSLMYVLNWQSASQYHCISSSGVRYLVFPMKVTLTNSPPTPSGVCTMSCSYAVFRGKGYSSKSLPLNIHFAVQRGTIMDWVLHPYSIMLLSPYACSMSTRAILFYYIIHSMCLEMSLWIFRAYRDLSAW